MASRNPFNSPPGRVVAQNRTGLPTAATPREVATATGPQVQQGQIRTDLSTFITKVGVVQTLYNADRLWAKVTVTLEDAGPVCVGTHNGILPVLSGNGMLLETNVPLTFVASKGNPIYIAATVVNRVKVQIEPLPWLEQITAVLMDIGAKISYAVSKAFAK